MGMEALNFQVQVREARSRERTGDIQFAYYGRNVAGADGFVENAFDWYSVSAFRYLQLIGLLADRFQGSKQVTKVKRYVTKVCGPVEMHRHKCGARINAAEPEKAGRHKDSSADLLMSSMPPITLTSDGYMANVWTVTKGRDTSKNLTPWSSTQFHENEVVRRLPLELLVAVKTVAG